MLELLKLNLLILLAFTSLTSDASALNVLLEDSIKETIYYEYQIANEKLEEWDSFKVKALKKAKLKFSLFPFFDRKIELDFLKKFIFEQGISLAFSIESRQKTRESTLQGPSIYYHFDSLDKAQEFLIHFQQHISPQVKPQELTARVILFIWDEDYFLGYGDDI